MQAQGMGVAQILVHMAQNFAPVLEANGGGAFAQMNSTASLCCGRDKFFAYAASKHAAYAIVQSLRQRLPNTLVMSVHPGPIATDMVHQYNAWDYSEPPSQVADALVEAMKQGEFMVYPDSFSKRYGDAYRHFHESIVEPCAKNTHYN